MSAGRLLTSAGLAAAALAAAVPPAWADFGPGATVVSASVQRRELADDASQLAAISADGRYVAVQTRASNLFADDDPDPPGTDRRGGVFRRDLQTGALELVASGDLVDEDSGALRTTGARNPSISADGRYVAFATGFPLVPADTNGAIDVYVRDMTLPASAPGAYTLVSVRADTGAAATYAASSAPAGQQPGADVWPLTSISADGRRVVYRTTADSDLPAAAGPTTPAQQLLLRDLDRGTTRLLTRSMDDGSPAGGAGGSAAISADGTTVTWAGANARAQTPFLNGEPFDALEPYYLWQRVADGPAATTRRITGLVDLDDPGCPPNGSTTLNPTSTGPCDGPLTTTDQGPSAISGRPIGLSGDGRTVFYLTPGYPRPSTLGTSTLDVFSADMRTGITRKAGSLEWTREGAQDDQRTSSGIDGLALTPDGRHLAIATVRTRFVGGRLRLEGNGRAIPDQRELYVADLDTGALERVVRATDAGDARGGDVSSSVSLSADGSRVAFVSGASNLFFGDANNRPDAFVADRAVAVPEEAPSAIADVPNADIEPAPEPGRPRIRVSVGRTKARAVRLTVTVPAAGRVAVRARGRLPAAGGRKTMVRDLAAATGRTRKAGRVQLVLRPTAPAKAALRRLKGLRATAVVRFVPAAGGSALSARRSVRLLPAKPRKPSRGRRR